VQLAVDLVEINIALGKKFTHSSWLLTLRSGSRQEGKVLAPVDFRWASTYAQ